MKIPKEISVCGVRYRVIKNLGYLKPITKLGEDKDDWWVGAHDQYRSRIDLSSKDAWGRKLNPQVINTTFLHEIIEAINTIYHLNLPHPKIRLLERGLYQVLHDNKLKF